jgi:mannitol 2-dehydrogenase
MKTTIDLPIAITATDRASLERQLDEAVAIAITRATHERRQGILVTRHDHDTTDTDSETVAEEFGVEDAWPVVCEPFEQWVLEDHFSLGRPPFEAAGVQLVDDVEPYELMKLRLLNASHQGMCYFGYLDKEATPTLRPVPGIDLNEYKHTRCGT